MEKVRKKIGCFSLACFLILSHFIVAKAEALPDIMSGSTTLADNIMTYYALSGSAVANTDWINTLYNSYGSNFGTIEQLANQGYLVMNDAGFWEPVQQLGEMIEQAPAYASLGLNEMFSISAEEAAVGGGFAAASGGSILAGSLGGVASTGVVPLLGGVTAAYWGGIAIGTLVAHAAGLYDEQIYYGLEMTTDEGYVKSIPQGGLSFNRDIANGFQFLCCDSGLIGWCRSNNMDNPSSDEQWFVNFFNPTSSSLRYGIYDFKKKEVTWTNVGSHANKYIGISYHNYTDGFFKLFSDKGYSNSNLLEFFNEGKLKNKERKSPDIIGPNGNQTAQYNQQNGEYTVPDMKPQIDPGQQAGKPLTKQDWLNFANGVSNNNNQTNPTDLNKTLFDNILDALKTALPGNNPNPDPDPDPWSPPVVTPVPDPSYPDPVPDQPTSENPDESENPQETEPLNPVDTGKPWMLPDLTKKFPFCIPWDIKDCFTLLKSNIRQAPHISWRFNPPNTPIDYTFNLDLSDFEPVAVLLRTLELIAFIAGLAFATRYIIGAS